MIYKRVKDYYVHHFCSLSKSDQSLPQNTKGRKRAADAGYQQPTVASRARSLSPYTHRKMCQLSEDARQRLGHLRLGPHLFRKETELQPPFLVRTVNNQPQTKITEEKSTKKGKINNNFYGKDYLISIYLIYGRLVKCIN
uniref:Uncharacterized protein n=1 Tax=Oryzias melastigma TaxID=30732 RepID=A0A3B3BSE5_ORYME